MVRSSLSRYSDHCYQHRALLLPFFKKSLPLIDRIIPHFNIPALANNVYVEKRVDGYLIRYAILDLYKHINILLFYEFIN